jgi:hypothetical protein
MDPNTYFAANQIVLEKGQYYLCLQSNLSSTTFEADLSTYKWLLLEQAEYAWSAFVAALQPDFDKWAVLLQVDYRVNDIFDQGDPFTWNYSQVTDLDGEPLPGYWRNIYNYYYGTDRPHITPWECLGFTSKPSYWDLRYGPAPYTRGNVTLWADLRSGFIPSGPRMGINPLFARPGLLKVIPVDDWGNLLNPVAAGIVVNMPSFYQASAPWQFGDGGPVETAWLKSEYYSYSQVFASYLLKPALLIEYGWNPSTLAITESGQIYDTTTNDRNTYANLTVHGETVNGTVFTTTGYQQWISDYLTNFNLNITDNFGDLIRGLNVQLGHKLAGFVIVDQVTASADNFGLIQQADITTALYNSPSIREEFYSGVIVQWTGSAYQVIGYDVLYPYFSIIPSDTSGPSIDIDIGVGQPISLPSWTAFTAYPAFAEVEYEGNFFETENAQVSGSSFDTTLWTPINQPIGPPPVSVIQYLNPLSGNPVNTVAYGTKFSSRQAVFDFLISYERYLVSQGWIFEQVDPATQQLRDWVFSGKEFLFWSIQLTNPGTFIALSPAAELAQLEQHKEWFSP